MLKTDENGTILKSPLELAEMSKEDLINYVDELHSCLCDYQIAIDQAKIKDKNYHH